LLSQNGEYSSVTDGVENKLTECSFSYTFGISTLQQFLVDMGDGRLQALPLVRDARDGNARTANML